MRQPGIEPRATAWKAAMLPLHHWRLETFLKKFYQKVSGGISPPERTLRVQRGRAPLPLFGNGNPGPYRARTCDLGVISTTL